MIRPVSVFFLSGMMAAAQPATNAATALPAGGDVQAEEKRREDLEILARQMKFDGLLVEMPEGLVKTVGDSKEAATMMEQVNVARRKYAARLTPDAAQQAGELAEYSRDISTEDEKDFNNQFGKEVLSICCPPSIAEFLLPALARGFLAQEPYSVKSVSEKQYGARKKLYGRDASGGFVALTVIVRSSADVLTALEKGDAGVGICYFPTTPGSSARTASRSKSRETAAPGKGPAGFSELAQDGLGVIVNPLAQEEEVSAANLTGRFPASRAYGVEGEPETAGFLGASLPRLLVSYEEVENRVFHEAGAWALVPLGHASVTDNKLLRIITDNNTYGTRATQLTVSRNTYPWTRKVIIGLGAGKAATEKAGVFKTFTLSPQGRIIVIQAGFAPLNN